MSSADPAMHSLARLAESAPVIVETSGDAPVPEARDSDRAWTLSRVAVGVLVAGLAVTGVLALTTLTLYDRNESRLLDLRARELGLVLSAALPSTQTPLASAAALADATKGDPAKFRALMEPEAGAGRQFASASLWRLGKRGATTPVAVVGSAPNLSSREARRLFAPGAQTGRLKVVDLLHSAHPSIGYEFSTPGVGHAFAVYAETLLPKSRRSRLESNSAFSDLDYAVYLGRSRRSANLLVTSLKRLPIAGRKASDVVPFGDDALTLLITPRSALGGSFFKSLPWIVAGLGILISLVAALIADRLVDGRRRAEGLVSMLDRIAAENAAMYSEQRSIAQTLQHALLPEALPDLDGLRAGARYVPATSGVEVGGDWYDVVELAKDKILLVIGDVSGHGLRAATTMASLRHATLAYAADDPRPAAVLGKLSDFVNRTPHTYFATVICALIDAPAHVLTLASAGHLPPLLIGGGEGDFIDLDVGVPIGVVRTAPYVETRVEVPRQATMIAYTDGLVERRGELLDIGLQRLASVATEQQLSLEDLLTKLPRELASDDHHDDTAILGIQWTS
jgi:serine phosphatase RsbU (regulator of sigma subunit)